MATEVVVRVSARKWVFEAAGKSISDAIYRYNRPLDSAFLILENIEKAQYIQ